MSTMLSGGPAGWKIRGRPNRPDRNERAADDMGLTRIDVEATGCWVYPMIGVGLGTGVLVSMAVATATVLGF